MKSLSFSKTFPDAEMLVRNTPCRNICCKALETRKKTIVDSISSKQKEMSRQTKEAALFAIRTQLPSIQDKQEGEKE